MDEMVHEGNRAVAPDGTTGTVTRVEYSEPEEAYMAFMRRDDGMYQYFLQSELKLERSDSGS